MVYVAGRVVFQCCWRMWGLITMQRREGGKGISVYIGKVSMQLLLKYMQEGLEYLLKATVQTDPWMKLWSTSH